jgi:hypothetical protein
MHLVILQREHELLDVGRAWRQVDHQAVEVVPGRVDDEPPDQ